jgi:hypothetical protein
MAQTTLTSRPKEGLLHRCKKVEELNLRKARIGNTQIERVFTYWPTLRRLNLVIAHPRAGLAIMLRDV